MGSENINDNIQDEPYISDMISDAVEQKPVKFEDIPEVKPPSTIEVVAHQVTHPIKEIGMGQIIAGIIAVAAAIMAIAEFIAEW